MSKKLLSVFLVLSMLFTMLPITAIAEAAEANNISIEDTELPDYPNDTVEAASSSYIEEDTDLQTVTGAVYDYEEEEEASEEAEIEEEIEEELEEELMEDNTVSDGLPEITGMMKAAAAPVLMLTPGVSTVSEQFTEITPGSTYYFDLSSEKDNIDEINTDLPDTTLHYVPFTYAGTVHAYSLHSRSSDDDDAKTDSVTADGNTTDPEHLIGYKSDRSLFVGDYNISNISWSLLSSKDLIFGKTFNTNYKLRVLSAGSNSDSVGDHYRKPDGNEWDQILAKSSGWIKNWSGIWSWGQDTVANDGFGRMTRGNTSTYGWKNETYYFSNGFRPALEVLDPDTLGSDGLKEVTLNLNGGSLNGSTDNIKIICAGDSFTAPSSDGLTAPTGKAFDGWKDTSSETIYAEGADVPHTVDGLTAQWGNDFVQNVETGETYGTLQGAVDAVADGQTIKLLKDVKEKDITINKSHPLTLELNGKILNSGKDKAITKNGNGTLKITDNSGGSGKITSANTYAAGTIYLKGGSLEVEGGTVENTGSYASCSAVYNEGSGSVIVSGGDIISSQGSTIYNHASGNVNVSIGTVKGNSGLAIQNDSSSTGNVQISGGTVEGMIYNSGSGSVNISGGIIKQTGTDSAICNWGNGKITISGTAKVSSANTSSTGGTIFLMNGTAANTVLEIKGGTIENTAAGGNAIYNDADGKIVISNGSPVVVKGDGMAINKVPDLSGYTDVKISASSNVTGNNADILEKDALTNSNISNYKYLKFETNNDVARIGSQAYLTLQAAVDAVADEQTITLLKDIDFTEDEIITTGISNRDFTLDLNGFTLNGGSGSSSLIQHNNAGTLTITDSQTGGKITSNRASSTAQGTIAVTANGSLIIDGGTVENTLDYIELGTDAGIAVNNRGTGYVRINNGTVSASFAAIFNNSSGSVIVNDGTITGEGNGIYNTSSGSVTVSGGDFCSNGKNARGILVAGSGSVTVSGGTLSPIGENANAIYIGGSATVTISDGTLSPIGENARAIYVTGSGTTTVAISGGTLSPIGANAIAVYVFDSGTRTVTISGGTISAEGEKAYGVCSLLDNVIKIHGGGSSPVIIKGQFKAMNKAPDLSEYADAVVTASGDYSGSPVVAYDSGIIGDYKYLKFEPAVPLTGTVTISGTPKYGETLTAAYVSGNNTGALSYQWQRGGSDISGADGNTYTIVEADIGQTLTCVATSSVQTGSVSSDPPTAITKADGSAAPTGLLGAAPSSTGGTDGKILGTNTAMEYADNIAFIGAEPCTGSEITGLSAGTYYVRVKATTTHEAGAYASVAVPEYVPSALTGTAIISNTTPRIGDVLNGSLVAHNNTGTLTYIWKADGAAVGTEASYTVTTADLGKAITLEISSSIESGTITSEATWAVLKKAAPTAPDAPTLVSKTHDSVTLTANAIYEFSKDGSTWQTSNVFSGLTASTAYTFYQRIAETDDTESSAASTGLSVTTNASGSDSGSGSGSGGHSSDDDRDSDRDRGSANNGSSASNNIIITITPPSPDKPESPTQGEIKVNVKTGESGNAVANFTGLYMAEAINKAMETAQEKGNTQNGITVILNVATDGKPVSNVTVNLPRAVQDIIIARRIVNTIVVVDNPNIRISMDLPTVKAINRQANSDVNVTASRRNNSELTGDARKAIGNRPVFDLKVNYGSGRQVQSFGDGSVWVTIPYTLGENEKAENICAVYIDENGKVHWLTNSVYDSEEKVLRFRTNHFSAYGVGYREELPSFTDIEGHWAKQDIEFIVSRGLFKGTSETTFSPDMVMTRGMFITVLGRLADADVSSYSQSSFTDVKNDAYYMGYIEWAAKNGIDKGIGDGKFAPDQPITREQMAVIMQNYAKAAGFELPKAHEENTFADSEKISNYAKVAVKLTQMAGIFTGKDGNLFDPQGTATRAEISAVLRRFVEL